MSLRTTRIRRLDELEGLEEAWRALERPASASPVFQSWLWNRLWCESVLPGLPAAEIDVLVLSNGAGRVRAILPLYTQPLAGPVLRVRQFLGHRLSYHNDALLAEPEDLDTAREAAEALVTGLGPSAFVHLRHMPADSALCRVLVAAGRAEPQCARLSIPADPAIADPAERLGPETRRSLRRRRRQLAGDHGCEFHVAAGEELKAGFGRFVELHRKRFAAIERTTVLEGRTLAFLEAAVLAPHEQARFEVLELHAAGVAIAGVLAVASKGRYFNINSGFDPAFARYAPLRILLAESMRRAFADLGCGVYEFGPGYEPHKYLWKPRVETSCFSCLGANLYTRLAASAYRYAFRRSLPGSGPPGPAGEAEN